MFSALTVGAFVVLDADTGWMAEWVTVAGAVGAVVVTAWAATVAVAFPPIFGFA